MRCRVVASLAGVDPEAWNALDAGGSPFLRHEFLLALERSGSAVPATGWHGQHLLLEEPGGRLAGAMPLYLKSHSWGEFVFDFAWAEAYRRAGLAYYPKLVSAVPFTPATGVRLLLRPDVDPDTGRKALLDAALEQMRATGASSLHLLFPAEADRLAATAAGLLPRLDCQFQWSNRPYRDFADFLAGLTAARRKKLRRERRRVREAGIRFRRLRGGQLDEGQLATVYRLHAGTFLRHGHEPYLTPAFLDEVARTLPDALVVDLAEREGEVLACTIAFRSGDTLYGRYWGADGEHHSLHFEACYYRGIEYCIGEGLRRFEPGTQGEHKLLRGFAPTAVWSLHAIADPRFRQAIARFLERERADVEAYIAAAAAHLPFRRAEAGARLDPDVRDHLAEAD